MIIKKATSFFRTTPLLLPTTTDNDNDDERERQTGQGQGLEMRKHLGMFFFL